MARKIVTLAVLFTLAMILGGCHTVHGIGSDLQKVTQPYILEKETLK